MGNFNRFRNTAMGLIASIGLHLGAGYEVHKIADQSKIESLQKDRENASGFIELPSTKEELIENLLKQTGAKSIEELQKNPELAHKIDLGALFIQIEFLESKIDAKQAKMAFLNLQLKRETFKELATEIDDERYVVQEIINEVAEPKIFLPSEEVETNTNKDYKSEKSLSSSYYLKGESNCYGATRAIIAIVQAVYPNFRIKLQELHQHIRPIITINNVDYVAETGLSLSIATPAELENTIVYEDAAMAFLSRLLKLHSKKSYIPEINPNSPNTNVVQSQEITNYENTEIGNYDGISPTDSQIQIKLRSLTSLPIPAEADRQRAEFNPTTADENLDNKIPTSSELKTIVNSIALKQRGKIVDETSRLVKKLKRQKESSKKMSDESSDEDKENDSMPGNSKSNQPTSETIKNQKKQLVLIEAESSIEAFIRDSMAHPEKLDSNDTEIMMWFSKLDSNKKLQEFIQRHQQEMEKLSTLLPKPGDTAPVYLSAKLLIDGYISKYREYKKESDENAKHYHENTLLSKGLLGFTVITEPLKESYSIGPDEIENFLKKAEKDILKLKKDKKIFGQVYLNSADEKIITKVFEFISKYPPKEIVIGGDFPYLRELQSVLDNEKARKTSVLWKNPPIGQSVAEIWRAIQEQRIQLYDNISFNYESGIDEQYFSKQFSMFHKRTKTIVDLNKSGLREKFLAKYVNQSIIRGALAWHNDMTVVINPNSLPNFLSEKHTKQEYFDLVNMEEIGEALSKSGKNRKINLIDILDSDLMSFDFLHDWQKQKILKENGGLNLFLERNTNISLSDLQKQNIGIKLLQLYQCDISNWGSNKVADDIELEQSGAEKAPAEFFANNNVEIIDPIDIHTILNNTSKDNDFHNIFDKIATYHPTIAEIEFDPKDNNLLFNINNGKTRFSLVNGEITGWTKVIIGQILKDIGIKEIVLGSTLLKIYSANTKLYELSKMLKDNGFKYSLTSPAEDLFIIDQSGLFHIL